MAGFESSLLKDLVAATGNEFAGLASEEEKFNTMNWIDTGSYALNALLSGSIYRGAPDNKIVGFSGEEATGKTFFTLACVKHFLDNNPGSIVALFETEHSVDSKTISSRGIDPKRVAIFPVGTVQEFRHQALSLLDKYLSKPKESRPRILIVLDSLAMLSSDAEVRKAEEGTDTKDFTLFQVSKATFRVLTLKLGKHCVPMYLTTHTYANLGGYGETSKVAGGSGFKYAASTIVNLSKAKYKEDKDAREHDGAVITCKLQKSRSTREGQFVKVLLHHQRGLDRYYGLLDIAEECGVIKKVGGKYIFPDGTPDGLKAKSEKDIINNPEKYFTKAVLDEIDKHCGEKFNYGGGLDESVEADNEE